MKRSPVVPNSMYALEASIHAQQSGVFDQFHKAAYRAYWQDGRNLGNMDVIEELAGQCGIDWAPLAERLRSGYYRQAVTDQHQEATDLGIWAVPAFIIGGRLLSGAQPYEVFQRAMAQAQSERDL